MRKAESTLKDSPLERKLNVKTNKKVITIE